MHFDFKFEVCVAWTLLVAVLLRCRFAFDAIDRQSTVVASPRMALLEPRIWKAILMHEIGHAIDFYVFGGYVMIVPAAAPSNWTSKPFHLPRNATPYESTMLKVVSYVFAA